MQAKTVKEVLIAARWIIAHVGWCQGDSYQDKRGKPISYVKASSKLGSCCTYGALCLVEFDIFDVFDNLFEKADNLLEQVAGQNIVAYNDAKGRTKKEVLALFDRAIKQAK